MLKITIEDNTKIQVIGSDVRHYYGGLIEIALHQSKIDGADNPHVLVHGEAKITIETEKKNNKKENIDDQS